MWHLLERVCQSPTLTTWGSLLLRTGGTLITAPLLLRRFTVEEISVWYLLSATIALQTVFELGFTPTFIRLIAYARATTAPAGARPAIDLSGPQRLARLTGTMRVVYRRLAVALLVLLGLGGGVAATPLIAKLAVPVTGWLAAAVALLSATLTFGNLGYSAFLQGADRIAVVRRIEMSTAAASIICATAAILAGGDLFGLAIATYVWPVVASELCRRQCLRLHPELFVHRTGTLDRNLIAEIWPATWRSGVGTLMSFGVIQATALIYAQTAPAVAVASFLFSLRVLQMLLAVCQAPFYSKLPRLARLYAEGESAQQVALAARGMALSHWVYTAGIIVIGLCAAPALQLIGSQADFVPRSLWFLMGLAFFVERYGAMHIQLYSLTSDIIWHRANGLSGALYIVTSLTTFPSLGVYAFPVAILTAYAAFYAWYAAWHSYRAFALGFWRFESGTSLGPAVALGLCTALVLTTL